MSIASSTSIAMSASEIGASSTSSTVTVSSGVGLESSVTSEEGMRGLKSTSALLASESEYSGITSDLFCFDRRFKSAGDTE